MLQAATAEAECAPLGKTALITGASSGIGRAIAVRLAERGVRVVALPRTAEVTEIHLRPLRRG